VPEQNLSAPRVDGAPAKEVVVLSGPAAEPTPHDAVFQTELPRQRGEDGRMTERVRGIQDVQPSPETFGIARAEQEIADE